MVMSIYICMNDESDKFWCEKCSYLYGIILSFSHKNERIVVSKDENILFQHKTLFSLKIKLG